MATGLAHVADAVERDAAVVHLVLEADDEGRRQGLYVGAGEDRVNARQRQRRAGVDGDDLGVGVGRAQDGGVQGGRFFGQVVDELAAAPEQRSILDAQHRLADVFALGFRGIS